MSDDMKAVWAATYGAAFARQVFDFMARGRGAPDPEHYEGFAEEAAFIADTACEQMYANPSLGARWGSDNARGTDGGVP